MSDDVLLPFIEAYRAEHSARSLDAQALRRRVAAASRGRSRRVERLRLLLPLAATLAGSIALAASPPARQGLRDVFAFVQSGVATPKDATPRSLARARTPGTRSAPVIVQPDRDDALGTLAPVAAPVAAPTTGNPAPTPAVVLAPPRSTAVAQAAEPPPASTPAVASFPVDSSPAAAANRPVPVNHAVPASSSASHTAQSAPNADLALYRQAHALHFSGSDRARTLAAWDQYLRTFPRGTFAPEARLNRAVCLAQLGQKSEAERVLSDIERGRFGRDGRGQARKLLEALDEE